MIVNRDETVDRLVRLMSNGNVKVITGIRRCGKSFLLDRLLRRQLLGNGLAPDRIVSVSLELKKNERLRSPDALHEHLARALRRIRGRAVVFVDELQMALPERANEEERKRAEAAIYGSLNELKARSHTDIFVTGSNSSFLSEDVATMFRGRADTVRICPFTFAEFLSAARKNELAAWKEYMVYGGMPGSLAYAEGNDRKEYLQGLFKTVYFKDIVDRNAPLADEAVLDHVSEFVMSAVGSLTNPAKLTSTIFHHFAFFLGSATPSTGFGSPSRLLRFIVSSFPGQAS
jgi:predicted AAA+ superfamily ATPase